MARTLVHRRDESVRVPFLRGILTRSLQESGLPFKDAYRIASTVRDAYRDAEEVTTDEIRAQVLELLEPLGAEVVARYRRRRLSVPTILVSGSDGHREPFSRGRHRLALAPCGLDPERRAVIVEHLYARLAGEQVQEVDVVTLGRRTYELLREEAGAEAARRYAVWEEFRHSERPLLLLIGGATGTGKSTITTELSHRLDIVRAQSTDMLREVMRMMIPERLMPVLHVSSFLAWQAIPKKSRKSEDPDTLLADGYLAQLEPLSVACEAVIQRAIQERLSLILEGVHVHPTIVDGLPGDTDAIVVPVMLGVLSQSALERRIRGRGKHVPGRRAKRYLKHLDAIWRLQAFLLSEADRTGVPIVPNDDLDTAVRGILDIVLAELSRHFEGRPERAFA